MFRSGAEQRIGYQYNLSGKHDLNPEPKGSEKVIRSEPEVDEAGGRWATRRPDRSWHRTIPTASRTGTIFMLNFSYSSFKSWERIGSRRIRLPVAAKMALATAGAIGGTGGSPTPPIVS